MIPSMSVEKWKELLVHIMKCRSLDVVRVFEPAVGTVMGTELQMKTATKVFSRECQQARRRLPTHEEQRAAQQAVLARQRDHVKMEPVTKRLILLHASFRNKVGHGCMIAEEIIDKACTRTCVAPMFVFIFCVSMTAFFHIYRTALFPGGGPLRLQELRPRRW